MRRSSAPAIAASSSLVQSIGFVPSKVEQRLDGAALVHSAITLRDVGKRQFEVEDPAWIDGAIEYQVHQIGKKSAHRRWAAEQALLLEEQGLAIELNPMRHADEADLASGARAVDGLHHRFLGADAFQNGIGPDT